MKDPLNTTHTFIGICAVLLGAFFYVLDLRQDKAVEKSLKAYVTKEEYAKDWSEHKRWSDDKLKDIADRFKVLDQVQERQQAFKEEIKVEIGKLGVKLDTITSKLESLKVSFMYDQESQAATNVTYAIPN